MADRFAKEASDTSEPSFIMVDQLRPLDAEQIRKIHSHAMTYQHRSRLNPDSYQAPAKLRRERKLNMRQQAFHQGHHQTSLGFVLAPTTRAAQSVETPSHPGSLASSFSSSDDETLPLETDFLLEDYLPAGSEFPVSCLSLLELIIILTSSVQYFPRDDTYDNWHTFVRSDEASHKCFIVMLETLQIKKRLQGWEVYYQTDANRTVQEASAIQALESALIDPGRRYSSQMIIAYLAMIRHKFELGDTAFVVAHAQRLRHCCGELDWFWFPQQFRRFIQYQQELIVRVEKSVVV